MGSALWNVRMDVLFCACMSSHQADAMSRVPCQMADGVWCKKLVGVRQGLGIPSQLLTHVQIPVHN